ncbi:MAG: hypothetical protein K6E21_02260 [Bacilli bacterium]|nr:hypothetical protein [Bacilli bacterium]
MVTELISVLFISLSSQTDRGLILRLDSDYESYNFVSDTGRDINCKRYIGNDTPVDYPSASNYLSATKVGNPSFNYNCHSFAWRYKGNLNNIDSTTNCVIDDETQFLGNPEYSGTFCYYEHIYDEIYPSSFPFYFPILQGDIIVYIKNDIIGDFIEEGNAHSAYVITPSTSFASIVVRSKWGKYGTYEHNALDCPYYNPQIIYGNTIYPERQISVFRLMHYYGYSYINPYLHNKHSICCTTVSENEAHRFGDSNGHLICLDCLYDTGIILYNTEDPSL